MTKIQKILKKHQEPTSYKKIFKSHNLPLYAVSEYLGCSYAYASQLLNGRLPITDRIKPKLDALVSELKAENVDADSRA